MRVDSAFATRTNTSASKQCLSIQSSRFGVTSTPGLSTKTTSSRKSRHLSFGQKIRTRLLSPSFSLHNAWPSIPTDCTGCFTSDPSVTRYASPFSDPSTWRKQLVVWPMPLGKIFSRSMALITVLFPLLVLKMDEHDQLCNSHNTRPSNYAYLPKKATFIWSLLNTSLIPWTLFLNPSTFVTPSGLMILWSSFNAS